MEKCPSEPTAESDEGAVINSGCSPRINDLLNRRCYLVPFPPPQSAYRDKPQPSGCKQIPATGILCPARGSVATHTPYVKREQDHGPPPSPPKVQQQDWNDEQKDVFENYRGSCIQTYLPQFALLHLFSYLTFRVKEMHVLYNNAQFIYWGIYGDAKS